MCGTEPNNILSVSRWKSTMNIFHIAFYLRDSKVPVLICWLDRKSGHVSLEQELLRALSTILVMCETRSSSPWSVNSSVHQMKRSQSFRATCIVLGEPNRRAFVFSVCLSRDFERLAFLICQNDCVDMSSFEGPVSCFHFSFQKSKTRVIIFLAQSKSMPT